jgi:hypothetical protein
MNADDTIGLKIGALGTTDARRREGAQDRKGKIILNKSVPLMPLIKWIFSDRAGLVQKKEECTGSVCDRTKRSVVGQDRVQMKMTHEMIRGKSSIEGNVFDPPRRARSENQI